MIALGAVLVADDRCDLWAEGGALRASPPASIAGLIEARGIGILRLPHIACASVAALVDLDAPVLASGPNRLPPQSSVTLAGVEVDFLAYQPATHFPSLLLCYLMGSRQT